MPRINGQTPPYPLSFPVHITPSRPAQPASGTTSSPDDASTAPATPALGESEKREKAYQMTSEMEALNPLVDFTTPDLIDFIITDLGAPLSPTSVSQYLVAQFSS
jgi:translation initiation factor eIF-2B subunit alpha